MRIYSPSHPCHRIENYVYYSQTPLPRSEEQKADFDEYYRQLRDHYQPYGVEEQRIVLMLAKVGHRLANVPRAEKPSDQLERSRHLKALRAKYKHYLSTFHSYRARRVALAEDGYDAAA